MLQEFELGGVEGGSASTPKLAVVLDRVVGTVQNEITLPDPSGWSISWAPVQYDHEAKDEHRSISRYRVGFRLRIVIRWDALSVDDRADLVGKICANEDNLIRCWPHGDTTGVFYDCYISAETDIDQYPVEVPIGYKGHLVLTGQRVFTEIPIFTVMEPFDYTQVKRGFYYTDSTEPPGNYHSNDPICYYTDSTEDVSNWHDDDYVAFFRRDSRAIGG